MQMIWLKWPKAVNYAFFIMHSCTCRLLRPFVLLSFVFKASSSVLSCCPLAKSNCWQVGLRMLKMIICCCRCSQRPRSTSLLNICLMLTFTQRRILCKRQTFLEIGDNYVHILVFRGTTFPTNSYRWLIIIHQQTTIIIKHCAILAVGEDRMKPWSILLKNSPFS